MVHSGVRDTKRNTDAAVAEVIRCCFRYLMLACAVMYVFVARVERAWPGVACSVCEATPPDLPAGRRELPSAGETNAVAILPPPRPSKISGIQLHVLVRIRLSSSCARAQPLAEAPSSSKCSPRRVQHIPFAFDSTTTETTSYPQALFRPTEISRYPACSD